MADTIKLPAIGPVKKTWVYIGGAVIIGIVGYAYWTRAREPAVEPPTEEESVPADRIPPPTVVGEQQFDQEGVQAIINTNTEWAAAVLGSLTDTGWEPVFVVTTIGKFLARRQLTQEEANLIQAAKGFHGEPPQGGPWPIVLTTPTPTPTPTTGVPGKPSVSIVKTSRTSVRISWRPVAGATSYEIRRVSGGTADTSWTSVGTATSHTASAQPTRRTGYSWGVRARNANGVSPEARTSTVLLG